MFTDSFLLLFVYPYPVKHVSTGQSVSKTKHHHLGSKLFRLELKLTISSLYQIKCVGIWVRVVSPET